MFKGVIDGEHLVVKLFMSEAQSALEAEGANLHALQGEHNSLPNDSLIPSLYDPATTDGKEALLLFPVATPFASAPQSIADATSHLFTTNHNNCETGALLLGQHLVRLVDLLHWVHKQDYVHRDIKLNNIFLYHDKVGRAAWKILGSV